MLEVSFMEIVTALIGISALNVGVIMGYIRSLHNQTEKELFNLKNVILKHANTLDKVVLKLGNIN